jgi:hypothetical protein
VGDLAAHTRWQGRWELEAPKQHTVDTPG